MNKPEVKRPLPHMAGMTGEFYGFMKHGELRFQRCTDCRCWRHVPRAVCPECGSDKWSWDISSGLGSLYTWSTMYRPLHPAFADRLPHAIVVVELEEGPRLLATVTGIDPDDLAFGMKLKVGFEEVADNVVLPRFERAEGAA